METSLQYEIQHQETNAIMHVRLAAGESFKAASGSLLGKSGSVTISGIAEGGPIKAVTRAMLGGEKLFFMSLQAQGGDGEAIIAPALPGQLLLLDINSGDEYFIQGGHFLAAIGEIDLETVVQQVPPGLLTGEGLFVLRAKGRGTLAVSLFGGMHEVTLAKGEDYLFDHGHLVAWTAPDDYTLEKSGQSWLSSLMSGEGFLYRFVGPARLWLQRRNPHSFNQWMKRIGG